MTATLTKLLGLDLEKIKIWSPVPYQSHPHAEEIEAASLQWSVDHGLCEPGHDGLWLGGAMADCMPFSEADLLLPYACYSYWAFLWDDHLDTLAADPTTLGIHLSEGLRVMHEPNVPVPDDRWLIALRDIRRMYDHTWPPSAVERLVAENSILFSGHLWKASLRARSEPPTVAEYLRMRWAKSGLGTGVAATTAASGYLLTAAEYADPTVRAFCQAATFPSAVANELVSLAKELIAGDASTNLVSVIRHHDHLTTAEAAMRVWQLYEQICTLTLHLQRQLRDDPRPAVSRLAAELPQWIPGAWAFMIRTSRYHTPAAAPVRWPSISLTDHPVLWDPDDLTPPPYPDIACWWHQHTR